MKITIVAPLECIKHTAQKVIRERQKEWQSQIEVVLGDLETGVEQARQAVARGTDVIISRGGTAVLIAREVQVPVVEIQVTAFDILRALQCIGKVQGTVGVVFARRVLYECERLGEYIGVPLREILMENEELEAGKIAAAVRDGIKVFLGDAMSTKMLSEQGLSVYPIQSGEEAIESALKEAQNLAYVRRKEQEKAEFFRTIINSSAEGIVAIEKTGRISIFNSVAEQLFKLSQEQVIGSMAEQVLPLPRLRQGVEHGKPEIGDVQQVGDKIIAVKHTPIVLNGEVVGAIANLQDVTQLQRFEQIIRQKMSSKGLVAKFTIDKIVGSSPAMEKVKQRIRQYAATDATVLITGESGTGKEMVAQSLHNLSERKTGPFVAVNCAALPENLLESELFGYDEGAFTGAKKGGKMGLFELAHGGTIFLDEIGEMPLALQARLLRVLQEKEVMRLGGHKVIPIDVRVVAATNQNLNKQVDANKFRADLYYRLNILRIHVPALRERVEDIPALALTFIRKFLSFNKSVSGLTDEAIAILQAAPWRGNVRELENVIERLMLTTSNEVISADDVRQEVAADEHSHEDCPVDTLELTEKKKVEQILHEEKFNYTRAAKRLGISRTTLWRKMQKWNNQAVT